MALQCISPPLVEPVTLEELKEMLRMDAGDTSQDGVLAGLNAAARNWCETICHRKFVQQTWRMLMDFFPGYIDMKLAGQKVSSPFVSGSNAVLVGIRYAIVLPFPPVQSLLAFNYQNGNGVVTSLLSPPGCGIDLQSQPARLTPPFGQMWPVARVIPNAVQMDFTVGYASPVIITATDAGKTITGSTPFAAGNVGQPISIPRAGPNSSSLNTVIMAVDGGGVATLRDAIGGLPDPTATALLVNFGNPGHWEMVKLAIKFLVNSWFVNRLPSFDAKTRDAVRAILAPAIDQRF